MYILLKREYDLLCVNVQDLGSSFLLRQTDLDLDLQPAGSQQGVVHHVPPALFCVCVLSLKHITPLVFMSNVIILMNVPIGHSDDEDVVELVDAVNLGEELVDDGVIHPGALPPA